MTYTKEEEDKKNSPKALQMLSIGGGVSVQSIKHLNKRSFGIPPGGAFDKEAMYIGNRLLKNAKDDFALEFISGGQKVLFLTKTKFVVTASSMAQTLNGVRLPLYTVIDANRGDVLSCQDNGGWLSGLCIDGGVSGVTNEGGTALLNQVYKANEKTLKDGDVVLKKRVDEKNSAPFLSSYPSENNVNKDTLHLKLFAIEGPHHTLFEEEVTKLFWSSVYTVSENSDRQGLRLLGNKLDLGKKLKKGVLSEATTVGSVQVFSDQTPVLLGDLHQTLGGYPQIAVVATVSIRDLAQAYVGTKISFEKITLSEAKKMAQNRYDTLNSLTRELPKVTKEKLIVNKKSYHLRLKRGQLYSGEPETYYGELNGKKILFDIKELD